MKTDPEQMAEFAALHETSRRDILMHAFDDSPLEIYAFDAETLRFVAVNGQGQQALGLSMRQLTHLRPTDVLLNLSHDRFDTLLRAVRHRPSRSIYLRSRHIDHDDDLIEVKLRYISDPVPTFLATIYTLERDSEAELAARKAEETLVTAIDALSDGFVLYDADDRLVVCNERYRQLYAKSADAMIPGTLFEDILRYGLANQQYKDAIGDEENWLRERLRLHKASNDTIEQQLESGQWLRIVERRTSDGGRVGLRVDISTLKNQQAELERVARTDDLTSLLNRRGLLEQMHEMAPRLEKGERMAVLHVDLDKFKSINDAQGHDAGDFVLRHCARLLCKGLSDDNIAARVGGDEFIAVLRTSKSDAEIIGLAEGLIAGLSLPVLFRDRVCNFGASIGIAFYQDGDGDMLDNVLTGADIALNKAKNAGRGECRVFEAAMRDETVKSILMADEIRSGLYSGEFEPHFQPQVNSLTGEVIGFEALIRWHHPERGLIPATDFLLAAEHAGLLDAVDHVMMDRACYAARQLVNWGVAAPTVSINITSAQLSDPHVLARLQKHMAAHDIGPDNLRLELLESTLLDERSAVIVENVHRLIAYGFAVELDDFGTGHAAISTLRKFAVNRIKVDRSLITNIDQDSELQLITGALIGLVRQLSISVLAEGVETQGEQKTLESLGCICAQGYLHARPMPLEQLHAWLLDRDVITCATAYPQTQVSG